MSKKNLNLRQKKKAKKDQTLNSFDENGISMTLFYNSGKDTLFFKINFPDTKNYYYYKEFTYEEIKKLYPIFGIEDDLNEINNLITESINNYGINILFNEKDENIAYLIIKIKINSNIREVKIELEKNDYSKDEYFNYLLEKVNNLLEERRKVYGIKSFKEVDEETRPDEIFNKSAENVEVKLQKLEKTLTQIKENTLLSSSNIITNSEEVRIILDLLKEIELENINDEKDAKYQDNQNIVFKLVYSASRDGDYSKDFHKRCDNIGPNITLVKTSKNIKFGGFTNNNWAIPKTENEKKDDEDESDDDKKNIINIDDGEQKSDPGAFCFSISNKKVYPHNSKKEGAICCSRRYGPTFADNIFSINNKMLTKGGICSKKDKSCFLGQNKDYEISGGEKKFKIKEVEVFEIVTI